PTDDPLAQPGQSLALTLRTEATTGHVSQNRRAFAVGVDSCYCIDPDTGEPLWRRVIGRDAPFPPVPVSGSPERVLVYSTMVNELMMLRQDNGQLLWRQSVGAVPSAPPLIQGDQIYITTASQELWQIAAVNGRAVAKVRFTQSVTGPPAVTTDGRKLLIPGDQLLIYTINLNPMECSAVSFTDHRSGSVSTPLQSAGSLFLMCENATAERAQVRVLRMDEESGRVEIRGSQPVEGQIHDRCLLRGPELFVPSTPQRVTAFRVTDDPDQTPLALTGANQLEEGLQTSMFLLAGPGGQLWLAGRDLRKFRIQTNAVILDEGLTAEGIHVRPVQFIDENVFLTHRSQYSTSQFFTRANPNTMAGEWRTVIGAHILAVGPSQNDQSVLAMSDFGQVFRVSLDRIAQGGFEMKAINEYQLPDKLASNVEGLALLDGRLAVYCGAPAPALWTFTSSGQLERKWDLPDAPVGQAVAIASGAVVPLPGRLHLAAAGQRAAEDYRASQTDGNAQDWKALVALNDKQVLAVTGDNRFIRVEYRATPVPQLAEISSTPMDFGVETTPTVGGQHLFVATTDGRLILMEAATFSTIAQVNLGGIPSATPRVAGNLVIAEVGNWDLKVFNADGGLAPVASLEVSGASLTGNPVALDNGSWLGLLSDGTILSISADGTQITRTGSLGQSVQDGPIRIGQQILAVAVDGTLHLVPSGQSK
ncbi:MAG: PQQ-binding-like beta-propeller repeat protein, partial [Planctomycetaceae bacterium]|nr:PQQ-binding-like beta-propeller repeat protein [Planctomycetaceae bacterium]